MFPDSNPKLTGTPDLSELEHLALSGQMELLHDFFRKIPEEDRYAFAGKYILHAVVRGGIAKLRKLRAISSEIEVSDQISFLHKVCTLFVLKCKEAGNFPREMFEALLEWSAELQALAEFDFALHYLEIAIESGVRRYPDLKIRLLIGKAGLFEKLGRFDEVVSLLDPIVERPYLNPDRNLMAQMLLMLGKAKLQTGEFDSYKKLLLCGVRNFYSNLEDRRPFIEQMRKNHRSWIEMLTERQVTLQDRAIIFLHLLYFYSSRKSLLRASGLPRLLKFLLMAALYFVNYAGRDHIPFSQQQTSDKDILITRAMGGIGDFLMMTPAFHRLKRKYPKEDLVLAIPHRFFSVFKGNKDVNVIDIEDPDLRCSDFKKWFNLSDCPAARVESMTAPKVKRSRIDIFARRLGLSRIETRQMDKRPRYFLTEKEKEYKEEYWDINALRGRTVVGVQLSSAELYRNYPFMRSLVKEIAREYVVLLFDSEPILEYKEANILRVQGLPLRKAFAVASGCDAIVAPDSVFVHLAAALDIPAVALYGPIDGRVRTKHYPKCLFVDARAQLECVPCWRNEVIPCRITNMRNSICMSHISVQAISDALRQVLAVHGAKV